MMKNFLTDQQAALFRQDGMLVVRDFYSAEVILQVQRGIYDIISQVQLKNGVADTRGPFDPSRFDAGYMELIRQNRAWGGEVYDAIKQIPAFVRLVADPVHEQLLRELRPGGLPGIAAGGYGIRIDNPSEDRFRAMWHQEYTAQLRSPDGLVFWSSLIPLTEELGPVIFCPGSHREGPVPVYETDPDGAGRKGAYALKLRNEEALIAKYPKAAPLMGPRDVVIIDFLTLHASGYNRSTRPRWSMQFRYFNFANPVGRAHGWSGSFAAGVDFRKIHPELFAGE